MDHAALGVGIVALPSSDWRGIDPLHTQMAALRAIETGASIVRSTRFGLSAGIDPHGRLRAWRSSFDAGDRVLLVDLPTTRVATIYGRMGDTPIAACAAVLIVFLATAIVRRKPR
jgi:apolipoprotein N-acyltransferase